jgi:hypothetical protein
VKVSICFWMQSPYLNVLYIIQPYLAGSIIFYYCRIYIMYSSLLLLLLVYRHYLYYNSCFCIWVSHDFVRCSTCVNFTVVGHSSMGCKISESYNAHVDVTSLCNAVWTVRVPSTLVSCDRVCYVRRQSRNWRKETTLGELGADWKIILMWTLKK